MRVYSSYWSVPNIMRNEPYRWLCELEREGKSVSRTTYVRFGHLSVYTYETEPGRSVEPNRFVSATFWCAKSSSSSVCCVLLHWFNIVQMALFWVYQANPKTFVYIFSVCSNFQRFDNLGVLLLRAVSHKRCYPLCLQTNQNRKWCLAWYLWIELTDFLFLVHEHAWLDIRLLLPVKWGDLRSIRGSQPKTPSERWLILIIHSCARSCSADRR